MQKKLFTKHDCKVCSLKYIEGEDTQSMYNVQVVIDSLYVYCTYYKQESSDKNVFIMNTLLSLSCESV